MAYCKDKPGIYFISYFYNIFIFVFMWVFCTAEIYAFEQKDIEQTTTDEIVTNKPCDNYDSNPDKNRRTTGIHGFKQWGLLLFLSAGLLAFACGIFNILRFLNDCLARRGIIFIKLEPSIINDDENNLPSYAECIAPPPSYEDVTSGNGGFFSQIRLPLSLTSSSTPYSHIPLSTVSNDNRTENEEQEVPSNISVDSQITSSPV